MNKQLSSVEGDKGQKLAVDQNKVSKCEHCGDTMVWLLRRDNVNHTLTDDDINRIAKNGLGARMEEWCENCDMFTLQTVVAFDLKRVNHEN